MRCSSWILSEGNGVVDRLDVVAVGVEHVLRENDQSPTSRIGEDMSEDVVGAGTGGLSTLYSTIHKQNSVARRRPAVRRASRPWRASASWDQDADAPLRALSSSGKMLTKSERRVMSKIST